MATSYVTPAVPVPVAAPSNLSVEPQQQQQQAPQTHSALDETTATTTTSSTGPSTSSSPSPSDNYFFSRLKSQVEFYFSPQNLSRDTYLRGLMAHYGGNNAHTLPIVPLSVIASFPKVRELCATKTGAAVIPPDPFLLMKAMEGSNVAKVSPDGYWISAVLPLPPLDPSAARKGHLMQQQQGVTVGQAGVGVPIPVPVGVTVQQQPVNVGVGAGVGINQMPAPLSVRQVSVGSGSNVIPTVRTASPLSNASSSEMRPNANATINNMNMNMNTMNMNMNMNTMNMNMNTSRTTLVVSDIPTDFATEVIMSAFTTENVVPKSARPGDPKEMAWYVTFASEQDAHVAIAAAASKTINGLPIHAKIVSVVESSGSINSLTGAHNSSSNNSSSNTNNNSSSSSKPSPTTTALPQEGFGEADASTGKQTTTTSPNRQIANGPAQIQQQPPGQGTGPGPGPNPYMGPPPAAPAYQYTHTHTPYTTLPPGMQPYPHPSAGARYTSHAAPAHHMQHPPPAPMPYPHNFYAHAATAAHPYQHQQYVRPPFYAPNQPAHVLFRHATDPGLRHNAKNKGGGGGERGINMNNNNGDGGGGGNNMKKKGGKNKKGHGQQQYQNSQYQQMFSQQHSSASQQYIDHSHGGAGLGMMHMAGQRSGRGSRESLDSAGGTGGGTNMNDFNRKGTGKSRHDGGGGQGGSSSRRKSSSPMMDDNVDPRSSNNKNKKKKSKRRENGADWDRRRDQHQQHHSNNNNNKTEIFDENMFPALSPSKSKQKSSGDVGGSAGIAAPSNNGFSGYADALRQKKNSKPNQEDTGSNTGKDIQSNSATVALEESVSTMKISDQGNDVSAKGGASDEPSTVTINSVAVAESVITSSKLPVQEAYDKQPKAAAEPIGTSPEAKDSKNIVSNNEPTPKEASEIDVKPVKMTEATSVTKENTKPVEKENDVAKATAEPETELNSAPTGAWGAKRSFIDVVKRQS
eukprot:CAMPEP_0203684164 /NCGR_PEP_ID=MMETSP0090-20130426/47898_1 /ASSEMBLY_ACC=CAM_ASM_001088 /TAXON_ID=426623 /ORGANISM="Chaetoceros affinis, Strain CCMP159" /LENGTH=969 /DNA_ID=CAMNT_0050553331 /DNA_START=675 /DNA_END=3584 /DNA_ORIENTATION=+